MPRRLGIGALKEVITRVGADDVGERKAFLLKEDVVKSLLERIYGIEKGKPRQVNTISSATQPDSTLTTQLRSDHHSAPFTFTISSTLTTT